MIFIDSYRLNRYCTKVVSISFLLLVCNIFVNAQKQERKERKQLFDYDWKFFLGDTVPAKQRDFNDAAWRSIDLPHDWSIEGRILPHNPTKGAGGYFPAGIGWYRKTFTVTQGWQGKKISIYFEGVLHEFRGFCQRQIIGHSSLWLYFIYI